MIRNGSIDRPLSSPSKTPEVSPCSFSPKLQARLAQKQPLPLVSVSDPLTTQAQEPGMGRAAFLALRRTGELREAVVQFVVGGALPDDLYKELQGYLRTEVCVCVNVCVTQS